MADCAYLAAIEGFAVWLRDVWFHYLFATLPDLSADQTELVRTKITESWQQVRGKARDVEQTSLDPSLLIGLPAGHPDCILTLLRIAYFRVESAYRAETPDASQIAAIRRAADRLRWAAQHPSAAVEQGRWRDETLELWKYQRLEKDMRPIGDESSSRFVYGSAIDRSDYEMEELAKEQASPEYQAWLAAALANREADDGQNDPLAQRDFLFVPCGQYWIVQAFRVRGQVKHSKGMTYIQKLLEQPKKGIPTIQLHGKRADASRQEIADPETVQSIKRCINELHADLALANGNSDHVAIVDAEHDIEELTKQLRSLIGFRGRPRELHGQANSARVAVSKAIGIAKHAIRAVNPRLGEHLDRSIPPVSQRETIYQPEGKAPDWWFLEPKAES